MSGVTIDRRDQVLIGRFVLLPVACSTFLARCRSTNGPFLIERGIAIPVPDMNAAYRFLRLELRRMIMLSVRLLVRVL